MIRSSICSVGLVILVATPEISNAKRASDTFFASPHVNHGACQHVLSVHDEVDVHAMRRKPTSGHVVEAECSANESVETVNVVNHDGPFRQPGDLQDNITEFSRPKSDMSIKLAFIACAISVEDRCKEEEIFAVESTLLGCLLNAQAKLTAWRHQNPEWLIMEYSCRYTHSSESEP